MNEIQLLVLNLWALAALSTSLISIQYERHTHNPIEQWKGKDYWVWAILSLLFPVWWIMLVMTVFFHIIDAINWKPLHVFLTKPRHLPKIWRK